MSDPITLFLGGDVMTGRGIDQLLAHPGDPALHEGWLVDAREYVSLAERRGGPIPRPVSWGYPWGEALDELERARPAARVVNLETSVTRSGAWEEKGINYRMHPDNVGVLTAARLDVCVLANNHVLDWGRAGLLETLDTLDGAGLKRAGAGRDLDEARQPAVVHLPGGGRLLVFAFGLESSGIPAGWAAAQARPGVWRLPDLSPASLEQIAAAVHAQRRPGDLAVASVHWGGNWGWEVPPARRRFARALVEACGVDLVHGHSSHHPLGIEVHAGRLILHGCGDLIDDYEGIHGHEEYRDELRLLYLPRLEPGTGRLVGLRLVPLRSDRLRLRRASQDDARWLRDVLAREGAGPGAEVRLEPDGGLAILEG